MKLSNNIEYIIDYKGNIIGKKPNEMIDIFSELKKKIPFKLKQEIKTEPVNNFV